MARFLKLLSLAVGAIVVIIIVSVGSYLIADYRAYQKVAITTALLRDEMYDPALHYNFDRACVFPTESWTVYVSLSGYHETNPIFPDSFTNWTLVLVDDKNKTFRTLYILEPKVKFGGNLGCSSRIVLRTTTSNGHIIANVEKYDN